MPTKKSILVAFCLVVFAMASQATPRMQNLYSDHRAVNADDIVTILIDEEASAGSKSETNTNTAKSISTSAEAGSGALNLLPSFSAGGGSKSSFGGEGNTQREGKFTAKISARVTEVLDNGNLVIQGSKMVEINAEKQIISITGIVRPEDIMGGNMVYSYNVAEAQITYRGKGAVADAEKPGLLTRFVNWLF